MGVTAVFSFLTLPQHRKLLLFLLYRDKESCLGQSDTESVWQEWEVKPSLPALVIPQFLISFIMT